VAKILHQLLALNRGLVSRLALARVDLKRMALSAETYVNWMPRAMGSMMLRPGLQYIGSTRNDAASVHLPFVQSTDDTAVIELTDGIMRVRIDDIIIARPAVTSTLYRWNSGGSTWDASSDTSSGFGDATDVGYWKDNDESGGVSGASSPTGYLSLLGNGNASAIRDRKFKVVETGVEHALTIVINRGNVTMTLGSTEGGDEYLTARTLRPGIHSIALTPTGDFFLRLANGMDITALVDSVTLGQAAGDMEIPTPWAAANLQYVRYEQSGDVIFVACKDVAQKRIERQGASSPRSWSVVDYAPDDGPFLDLNTGPNRLKGSALTGDITLTSERPFFKSSNVGSLFRLTSAGQQVTKRLQAQDTFSDYIRVTGIDTGRVITIEITGPTFTATTTVTMQRSVGAPGDWTDVLSWTGTTSGPYSDTLDNQIIYYRIGIKTGQYTASDDITATLTFSAGSISGIVRATAFLTSTTMSASVLSDLGKADQYTSDWSEGAWSSRRGWPSAVCLFDGRLYWAGKDNIWGSGPDLFDSFDDTVEGDARTIKKSLGSGPVDSINWLLPVLHLLVGAPGATEVAKASSFDEPLTQTKFGLKPVSSSGTAAIAAVRVDSSGVFVSRSTSRVIELSYDGASYTYVPQDLTAVIPDIGLPGGFVRVGVQRYPDTRLHFVRADGVVCVLLFDKTESVSCWLQVTTDGEVEDVVVLPGTPGTPREDRVYYQVKRTINGSTKRYLEKWALESQGQGAADTRLVDCHVAGTGAGSAVVTGLDHLEGETVNLWGNTKDLGSYTVAGGQITASEALTGPYAVGLDYTAQWMSAKLAVASQNGAPLTQHKIVKSVGVILADTHAQGLKVGQDFDHLDNLPLIEQGKRVADDYIWTAYDQPSFPVNGTWSPDSRICLQAQSPRPCTVLGIVIGVEGHDKI
jgi:hypothetical protein